MKDERRYKLIFSPWRRGNYQAPERKRIMIFFEGLVVLDLQDTVQLNVSTVSGLLQLPNHESYSALEVDFGKSSKVRLIRVLIHNNR